MKIVPTIAMQQGDGFISQCNNCGVLVAVTSSTTGHRRLAGCPSCDKQDWHQVNLPVGPFKEDDLEAV